MTFSFNLLLKLDVFLPSVHFDSYEIVLILNSIYSVPFFVRLLSSGPLLQWAKAD